MVLILENPIVKIIKSQIIKMFYFLQFCNYFAVFSVVNQRFKDVQHIIESKRELLSRETYSLTPVNYSEGMVDDQKNGISNTWQNSTRSPSDPEGYAVCS